MIDRFKRGALGLAVALGFFLVLEAILWAVGVAPLHDRADPYVGFAGYSPLFVEGHTPDGQPVFETSAAKLDWFNPQQFPARKASGVTRIFCLGGSTTYGRPYDDLTSFCGWLREFLPAVDPSRRWEVVNAGGISYASYRVARLMKELAGHEPDLFVVYTGHNEFLEHRTYDRLLGTPELVRDLGSLASRLRLYSVLSDVTHGRKDILAKEVDAVLDESVGPEDYHRDDAMQDAVLEHFQANLRRMVRTGQRAGADLMFVTPASNLGDFSPFKAEPSPGVDAETAERAARLERAAVERLDAGDPAPAAELVRRALEFDPRNADLLFLEGRALRDLGQMEEARQFFVAARDEDVAPLRALTPVRGIVTDVSREYGAGLVDFVAMMTARAPGGIPGDESFLDHVHPTVEANRRMALAIVDEMVQMGLVEPAPGWGEAVVADIAERVEASIDDSAHARALTNLSRVLTWAGKQEEASRLVDRALSMDSDVHTVFQKATVLVRAGRYEEALPYSEEAVRLMPDVADVHRAHGILLGGLGRNEEALRELKIAARLDPEMKGLYYHLGLVLSQLGRTEEAERAYRRALELEPDDADTCNNLGILLARRGDLEAALRYFERAIESDPEHAGAEANLKQARRMLTP